MHHNELENPQAPVEEASFKGHHHHQVSHERLYPSFADQYSHIRSYDYAPGSAVCPGLSLDGENPNSSGVRRGC